MIRSLQTKIVLILILLIVSVMAVMGTFLINNITGFYLSDFTSQMSDVFKKDFQDTLSGSAATGDLDGMKAMIAAYSGPLGIDAYRNFYILDGKTGEYLAGSDDEGAQSLKLTPNIVAALNGKIGNEKKSTTTYMDFAIPISSGENSYVVYVKDTKQELSELTWVIFVIVVQAVIFGFISAIILSFLLSKTITNPIENLTKGAKRISSGDFSEKIKVYSNDEIGVLTDNFNNMADVLRNTLLEIDRERDKLQTLFYYLNDGVAAFTEDGRLMHVNPACRALLENSFEQGTTFNDVFGTLEVSFDEVLRLNPKTYKEYDMAVGERRLKIFFAPFKTENKDGGVLALVHDVTSQQKMEDARREFVANVSHELRTPLTNIKSYAETILDNPDLNSSTQSHFLNVILNESDRMTRIVKDLLILSRLDYSKMDWKFSRFDVKALMNSIFDAMYMDAKNHNHDITLQFANDIPNIIGDKERIEQAYVNIVSNAIKYTPDGGKISLRAGYNKGSVWFSVKDSGVGIPHEDLPRLFERFYRVDKARSREGGGTGLGLSIAKEIVEYHKGTISVESYPEQGTTITVTIPADLPLPA